MLEVPVAWGLGLSTTQHAILLPQNFFRMANGRPRQNTLFYGCSDLGRWGDVSFYPGYICILQDCKDLDFIEPYMQRNMNQMVYNQGYFWNSWAQKEISNTLTSTSEVPINYFVACYHCCTCSGIIPTCFSQKYQDT